MVFEVPVEKWASAVNTVTLGATAAEGGTRASTVTVGGSTTLPFLHFEGEIPNRPVIAMEVLDMEPQSWPETLSAPFDGVLNDPAAWAKKCVEEYGAEMICLRLLSAHPDSLNTGPEEAAAAVKKVLGAVGVPLIIWGCGQADKDNEIMPRASEAAAGENCLLGSAEQDNYKTITAACLADGHKLITAAPIDINIQKQVNILVTEMGLDAGRIVMFQATGGLGYGMEYAYSIMERTRLAALGGDKMLSMPLLAVVGPEAWKAKEAKTLEADAPQWGAEKERGVLWEAMTATCFLHGGTDILVMWHPKAVEMVRTTIDGLMKK
ncbi:MAG: acetyl-CoA decarbonylase/synthase complex subunit delta [Armatimonadetes bacterium]|nr:acetyl-CoA decarbonylase/synthase complex subunit delta [Armatimonadota bacterium]NIM23566.1 acetyl-CoA decarbonylase/synthase complex subunit delta [Armatimonadota bacterium]NIM67432.1 acetyl-CoA decarbonylase/synthase complex subunit delta [Armatimonadota bacterium]NIM75933.1 acetyl-CoA decarbonylase/synthase complex subunit delta [Armatimonadota bacterium]NIN05618.1 acetyl-CoA decarbonylase/synthase complex subunit delta [Armatimonadota bacterium]